MSEYFMVAEVESK